MSFILDALRKSEHERERRALPGLIEVPVARRDARPASWLLAGVGALLLVNAVVLTLWLRRPAAPAPAPVAAPSVAAAQSREPVRAMLADAGRVRPLAAEVEPRDPALDTPEPPPVSHVEIASAPLTPVTSMAPAPRPIAGTVWPTLHQLPTQTVAALPPLNLDLHVYSAAAAQRFVIINGQRLHEGGQLREGLLVEQITPEGALLNHQGTRFVLPRE